MEKVSNLGKSIAIVGRPNVGKSRLFNRLIGKRLSIVHDQPGVTRDIVAELLPNGVLLMDTGGIGATEDMTEKVIANATDVQANFAIQASDLILFVVDSQDSLTVADERIAKLLRSSSANVALVVNKTDLPTHAIRNDEFFRLGFKNMFFVSAEHGYGMESLFAFLEKNFGSLEYVEKKEDENLVKICVAGRPNVGKSSIGNRLLGSERLIVSEVAGTTRDAVKCDIAFTTKKKEEVKFRFFDTAGLKSRRKVNSSLDYLSSMRAKNAIESCDVVMLVIDAARGVSELDKTLAGEILSYGASIMLVVNKWDLALETFKKDNIRGYENVLEFKKKYEEAVRKELFFIEDSPLSFVSARDDKNFDSMLEIAYSTYKKTYSDLPTSKLNNTVRTLIEKRTPKMVAGKRYKVYYCVQTAKRPITIRMYCNSPEKLDDRYKKYLEKNLRKELSLGGVSIAIESVGKERESLQERLKGKQETPKKVPNLRKEKSKWGTPRGSLKGKSLSGRTKFADKQAAKRKRTKKAIIKR